MKAKRAQFSDLPSNFDIAKYAICADWSLGWWVANLLHRIYRRQSIEGIERDQKYLRMMQEAATEAFDDPELNWGNDDEGQLFGIPSEWPALARRVIDLTAMDVLRARDLFDDAAFSAYTSAYEKSTNAADPFRPGVHNHEASEDDWKAVRKLEGVSQLEMMRECGGGEYDPGPFAFASVDLMAPDEELIDDFREWLRNARNHRGISGVPRSFTSDDMRLWSSMQVLAYIDLTLWAQMNGLTIGAAVMGRALFPNEFDIGLEDRVRKVVSREAHRLMSMETLRSMQSQHIKAEREKTKSAPD
jgi:hypothetical protein